MKRIRFNVLLFLAVTPVFCGDPYSSNVSSFNKMGKKEDKTVCPQVKGARNFDLHSLLGSWYVVQYYATSEEDMIYKCMRAVFSTPIDGGGGFEIEMNVTYVFVDDPSNERLAGNITWKIPDINKPAHWIHAEDIYEGVYNTYVIDTDNNQWGLLLHCAEKPRSPRYLTSLMISRTPTLGPTEVSYLRQKLPRFDISLEYMFEMNQTQCEESPKSGPAFYFYSLQESGSTVSPPQIKKKNHKHPLKRRTRFVKTTAKPRKPKLKIPK